MRAYFQDLRVRFLLSTMSKLGTWTIALKYKDRPSWIGLLVQRRREC